MKKLANLFNYIFIDNKSRKTLFLLHGTGGSKNDFLFLDKLLEKKYNLVALQGNIDENGMTRFFKRHSQGVFDQNSIQEESNKLKDFILEWQKSYQLKTGQLYFLGYSNGANILLAALLYFPEIFSNLILLHPMLPFKIKKGSLNLDQHKIFLTSGKYDRMIPLEESQELIRTLQSCRANLFNKEYPSGHEISKEEILEVVKFLKTI